MTKVKSEIRQKVAELISQLMEAQRNLTALVENEEQTPKQLSDAIRSLMHQNPPVSHDLQRQM